MTGGILTDDSVHSVQRRAVEGPCGGCRPTRLSAEEIKQIDAALGTMPMSGVFSGSPVKSREI